jgi:hypothetical protein
MVESKAYQHRERSTERRPQLVALQSFPRVLRRKGVQKVLGRFLVSANVDARHGDVVNDAGVSRT